MRVSNNGKSANAGAGVGRTGPSSGAKGPALTQAAGAFMIADAASATAVASPPPPAASAVVGALINLQVGDREGRARTLAVARRTLELLDAVQHGLLTGRIFLADLKALAHVATAKAETADAELAAIFNEIGLRARVELAKLGH